MTTNNLHQSQFKEFISYHLKGLQSLKSLRKMDVKFSYIFFEMPGSNSGYFEICRGNFVYIDYFQNCSDYILLKEFMESWKTLKSS